MCTQVGANWQLAGPCAGGGVLRAGDGTPKIPPRSLPPHQGECQALGPATTATLFPPLTLPGLPSVPGGSGQPDPKPLPAQTACFHEGQ